MLKRIASIDQTSLWRTFAIAATLLGVIYILYDNTKDTNPKIVFEVTANTSVVDIREKLPKLSVLFDGVDIQQQQQSLQIIAVKVLNQSTIDILKDRYDTKDPFGLAVSQGQIIQCEVTTASNEYLLRNARARFSQRQVYFSDVILEAGQYFVVKILLLVPSSTPVQISAVGHVGGVLGVSVVDSYRSIGQIGILSKAFDGSIPVQILRFVSYISASVLVGVLILTIAKSFDGKVGAISRRRLITHFKSATMVRLDGTEEWIFDLYRTGDARQILALYEVIRDEKNMQSVYKVLKSEKVFHYEVPLAYGWFLTWERAKLIFERQLIREEAGKLVANTHFREVLGAFIAFLLNKKALTRNDLPVPDSKVHLYGNGTDMFIQVTQGQRVYGMRIPNAQAPIDDPIFTSYLSVEGIHNASISGKDGATLDIPMQRNKPTGGWTPEMEDGTEAGNNPPPADSTTPKA